MDQKAISVSQLSGYIKGIFEAEELLHNIAVYGEISGLSVVRGNAYFSLKDEDALLSCVYFGADEKLLKNGDLVTVVGSPRYYVKGGKLNFNVVKVEPFGIGDLYKKFLETKAKLEGEGLFLEDHKKDIPKNVKRIGVVTSETGAVIQDIINVTSRRDESIDIVLYPSKVQGEGAQNEIISGIRFFENYNVDVIIVARGGGSFEDLNCFNDENLARAVYACEKPIVSAVGHETDFTIIDFVSDLRAPTPSAGAELVVPEKKERIQGILSVYKKLETCVDSDISDNKRVVVDLKKDLENYIKNVVNDREYGLNLIAQAIDKLNPRKILERGYAKIESNGKNITNVAQVNVKDDLEIYLKDGKITSEVTKISKEN